ncbi:MAG TPA: hypothetical protein VFX02_12195 [Gammaproteobacteria bacterium]|nr:hypothetical protein [Gammaproteobacteria bacterium]
MNSSKHPASFLAVALLTLAAMPVFANQYGQGSQGGRNDRSNQSQSYQGSPGSQSYGSQSYQGGQSQSSESAENVIRNWKETPQKVAREMLKKYGQPQEVTENMLVWHDNGPWKHTVITNEEIDHKFPLPHKDALLQVVAYQVPTDKFDELAAFDGSVVVDRTRGEIGAHCDNEAANFLALNLANEIATGKRSVEEARKIYGEQIVAFAKGKPSSYTKELNFRSQFTAPDADKATLDDKTADQVTKLMKEKEEKMARGEDSNETIIR